VAGHIVLDQRLGALDLPASVSAGERLQSLHEAPAGDPGGGGMRQAGGTPVDDDGLGGSGDESAK
jgi:hypothetical protein